MTLTRLAISCGGTGGHFNPGLSIARELKARGGTPVLILGGKHVEKQAETAAKYGIESVKIEAVPLTKNPFRLPLFFKRLFTGAVQTKAAYRNYGCQALLCMGSFASFPPALCARINHFPLFLHDGNAKIGRANRMLSRWAKALALSFPVKDVSRCKCPTILTGMPLRQEIVNGVLSKADAVAEINRRWDAGFSAEKPLLLVFGGSLGARTINTKVQIPPDLPGAAELQVIRLVGPGNLEKIRPLYAGSPARELILEACQDMNILYSAADLVICRSGGSTVSELAVYGKYAVLIPFPFAADGHQDDNARWLAAAGGAAIIADSDCSEARFASVFASWLADRDGYSANGRASRTLARPAASAEVLDMIDNILSVSQTMPK